MNDSRGSISRYAGLPDAARCVRITQIEIWEDGGDLTRRTMRRRPWLGWLGGFALGACTLLIAGSQLSADSPRRDTNGITIALAAIEPKRAERVSPAPRKTVLKAQSAFTAEAIADPLDVTADAALARAFATNEATEWRSGSRYGMVVVGPASIEAGRYCRDVAVLTREDGVSDRTLNDRRCRGSDGSIRSVEPVVLPVAQP